MKQKGNQLMNTQERNQLLAEKTSLERMIMSLPESSVIDRMSLQARKEKVEKELGEPELIAYDSLIDLLVDLTDGWLCSWKGIQKQTGLPIKRCEKMERQLGQVYNIFDRRRK
jgi:hypothetical protein